MKNAEPERADKSLQLMAMSLWCRSLAVGLSCLAILTGMPSGTLASNFTFQGQNAALFPNTNPGNMSVFMNSVEKPPTKTETVNPASMIEQSIISQLSSKIYNDIFKGAAVSGYYDLGDGSAISYSRNAGTIKVDITDPSTGTTSLTVLDQ
ncbi:MAG: curli assembly protein CsgF [Chlorobiales bacterium]|nr:curli assembly protein CsgF [Chlorobiales bacterium]